jgi:predicted RNA binding protein YcfA (HicA-like mRNA interferase family)
MTYEHPDGRHATIPDHGSHDIVGGTYFGILKQLGITEEEFRRLK